MEKNARSVTHGDWHKNLDEKLKGQLINENKNKRYDGNSVCKLLRFIRNKVSIASCRVLQNIIRLFTAKAN